MDKRILLFLFFLIFEGSSYAQGDFKLSSPGDVIGGGLILPLNIGGNIFYKNKLPLTIEKINSLDANSINPFDRSAVKHYSLSSKKASDIMLAASLVIPFSLLLDKNTREDPGVKGVIYIETLGITAAEIQIVKSLVSRARPFTYNAQVPLSKKLNPDADCSFFSGHTATATAACFFAAGIYGEVYPKNNGLIWAAASVPSLLTGYFRYSAGRHFFTDILTGFIVGAVNGFIITEIHKSGN